MTLSNTCKFVQGNILVKWSFKPLIVRGNSDDKLFTDIPIQLVFWSGLYDWGDRTALLRRIPSCPPVGHLGPPGLANLPAEVRLSR